jgi:hypothetical protein
MLTVQKKKDARKLSNRRRRHRHFVGWPSAGCPIDNSRIDHNRWYDPSVGKWLSEDPSGLAAGANPYSYCGDAPTDGIDPSGLQAPDSSSGTSTSLQSPLAGAGSDLTKLYSIPAVPAVDPYTISNDSSGSGSSGTSGYGTTLYADHSGAITTGYMPAQAVPATVLVQGINDQQSCQETIAYKFLASFSANRTTLNLSLRVLLNPDNSDLREKANKLIPFWTTSFNGAFDGFYFVNRDHPAQRVNINFSVAFDFDKGAQHDATVSLHAGNGRSHSTEYYMGDTNVGDLNVLRPGLVVAHEVGHLFGLADVYKDKDFAQRAVPENSYLRLMGDGSIVTIAEVQRILVFVQRARLSFPFPLYDVHRDGAPNAYVSQGNPNQLNILRPKDDPDQK